MEPDPAADPAVPAAEAGGGAEYRRLEAEYRRRFDAYPPVMFMPEALAVEVMRAALASGEAAPPEAWPEPGCNCA